MRLDFRYKGDGGVAVLCAFLMTACYYDYRRGRIPNWLVAFLFAIGAVESLIGGGALALKDFFIVTVLVVLSLYPLFKIGGLGAGDVKLLGACAGYLPADKILLFLFFSMLIAAVISLIYLLREHDFKERLIYFCRYVLAVLHSGHWKLYMQDGEKRRRGVCLSGPVLCSILMYLGGIY